MQAESTFFQFHLSNLIEIGAIALAWMGYRRESRKDAAEREIVKQKQIMLHQENSMKLEAIIEFNKAQASINRQRDSQITMLSTQTTQLTEIAKGFERRLTMLEDND